MKNQNIIFNPEFAVAICCGLQILAATLVYCFYHPVLLTGPQKNNKIKTRLALSYKPLQLRVSLRFTAPRYEAYCKTWDNT
jgi:hypothetical protein